MTKPLKLSAVRAKVDIYNQLDAKSREKPELIEVRKGALSRQSTIYGRILSFEMAARQQKKAEQVLWGPTMEESRMRRETSDPTMLKKSGAGTVPEFSL